MRQKSAAYRRVIGFILLLCVLFGLMPQTAFAESGERYVKIADEATFDGFADFFGNSVNTENSGKIWTDKSVFADDATLDKNSISLSDSEKDFLVCLSALSANDYVTGYSNIPSDTVLILDVSGSMKDSAYDLAEAANKAMNRLFSVNYQNRIGVVVYSGGTKSGDSAGTDTASVLLPLGRYEADGENFISVSKGGDKENPRVFIEVANGVKDSEGKAVETKKKEVTGATYIQNGLFKALDEFLKVSDTEIKDGIQAGTKRIPITVLMSDGAPTVATSAFADVKASEYGTGSAGNAGMSFLTQLTAAFVKEKTEEKYGRESFFYTLGLGLENDKNAESVLSPSSSSAEIEKLRKKYLSLSANEKMKVSVFDRGGNTVSADIFKHKDELSLDYVDRFFAAEDADDVVKAFEKIIEKIILQSRYYPTLVSSGNYDSDGYITFTDALPDFTEVKDMKGIVSNGVLCTGAESAEKLIFAHDKKSGDGAELFEKLVKAVSVKAGIDEKAAENLIEAAVDDGQFYYSDSENYNNMISWYADKDGKYISFCGNGKNAPENAAFIIRDFEFCKDSKDEEGLINLCVYVREEINSGKTNVVWKIPASKIPVISYHITFENADASASGKVFTEKEDALPIRLVFETGPAENTEDMIIIGKTDGIKKNSDGTFSLYTNAWREKNSENEEISATAEFEPSKENRNYYYTENSAIYKKTDDGFELLKTEPDKNAELYTLKMTVTGESYWGEGKVSVSYEKIQSDLLEKAEAFADGTRYIPKGTPKVLSETETEEKTENKTDTLSFARKSEAGVSSENGIYCALSRLGNNGRLDIASPQGVAVTKTLYEEGDNNSEFSFILTLKNKTDGRLPYLLCEDGKVVSDGFLSVASGKAEFSLKNGQTVYITGLETGTEYVIEEKADPDYRVLSVNGDGNESSFAGTVSDGEIAVAEFVNTLKKYGSLTVKKTVTHSLGDEFFADSEKLFHITAEFSDGNGEPMSFCSFASDKGTFVSDKNGTVTFVLKAGEEITFENIPEDTCFVLSESEIPEGFSLKNLPEQLSGKITADKNEKVILENGYSPLGVSPEISVCGSKTIAGREWLSSDSFTFVLERLNDGEWQKIAEKTVTEENRGFDFSEEIGNEKFSLPGVYSYRIYEKQGSAGGMTYDRTQYEFSFTVTDIDTDGKLEISDISGAEKSGNDSAEIVCVFTNEYEAQSCRVGISGIKTLVGKTLEGGEFTFSLCKTDEDFLKKGETVCSAENNGDGVFSFPQLEFESPGVYRFVIFENTENAEDNVQYDGSEYFVTVRVFDTGEGFLNFETSVEKDGIFVKEIRFKNVYEEKTSPKDDPPPHPDGDTPKPEPSKPEEPVQTSDFTEIIYFAGAVFSAAGAMLAVSARKKVVKPEKKDKGGK